MISLILFSFLALLGLFLESSWLHIVELNSVMPDLILIMVVSFSMVRGKKQGRILGFIAGLLQDILFARFLGLYALLYYVTGHVIGRLSEKISLNQLILPIAFTLVSDLTLGVLQFIFLKAFTGDFRLFHYFLTIILPETCYTTILCAFLYPLNKVLVHLFEKLDLLWISYRGAHRRI